MAPDRVLNTCWNNFLKTNVSKYHSKHLYARNMRVRVKFERGPLACETGLVCFVSKMSICLCKVIPYDLPKYTGLGCPSGWQLRAPPPSPLTPTTASPGLEVLPFYLPLRGYEKARQSFPFSSYTVRFLDQCNPQMAATRVQRFGCSLTTDLTTKQCNGSRWKGTLRRILHVQKISVLRAHTHS